MDFGVVDILIVLNEWRAHALYEIFLYAVYVWTSTRIQESYPVVNIPFVRCVF